MLSQIKTNEEQNNPYEATAIIITDMTPTYIDLPENNVICYLGDFH